MSSIKSENLKIVVASRVAKDGRPIEASHTKSPYLAIHKALDDWNDGFTITHIPTGYAVTQQCSTERQAQLICAALAAMPYPWDKCTVKNATKLFRALPKCWQDWLQEIRKAA